MAKTKKLLQGKRVRECAAVVTDFRRLLAGEIPPPPSAEALWMHFAAILPEPVPMAFCQTLAYMLEVGPGDLFIDGTSLCYTPKPAGALPLIVDNRPVGPHPHLNKRIRRFLNSRTGADMISFATKVCTNDR